MLPDIDVFVDVADDNNEFVTEPPDTDELFEIVDVPIVVFCRVLLLTLLPLSVDVDIIELVDVELIKVDDAMVEVAIYDPNIYE
mgnify:FL=1